MSDFHSYNAFRQRKPDANMLKNNAPEDSVLKNICLEHQSITNEVVSASSYTDSTKHHECRNLRVNNQYPLYRVDTPLFDRTGDESCHGTALCRLSQVANDAGCLTLELITEFSQPISMVTSAYHYYPHCAKLCETGIDYNQNQTIAFMDYMNKDNIGGVLKGIYGRTQQWCNFSAHDTDIYQDNLITRNVHKKIQDREINYHETIVALQACNNVDVFGLQRVIKAVVLSGVLFFLVARVIGFCLCLNSHSCNRDMFFS